jgi:hypothetical protein
MDNKAGLQHKRQIQKNKMSNSQQTKINRDKSEEKKSSTKKGIKKIKKNVDLKRIRTKFDIKIKSNHEGRN